jgi:hypothetical protein
MEDKIKVGDEVLIFYSDGHVRFASKVTGITEGAIEVYNSIIEEVEWIPKNEKVQIISR